MKYARMKSFQLAEFLYITNFALGVIRSSHSGDACPECRQGISHFGCVANDKFVVAVLPAFVLIFGGNG